MRYALAAVYVGLVVFNAGAFYADVQSHCYSWKTPRREVSEVAGFAIFGPLSVPAALLTTGFLEHGWKAPWDWTDPCHRKGRAAD